MKKAAVAFVVALMMVPFMGTAAFASGEADASGATEKVECLVRVYVNEGGESGLDCLD